jgi:hypothetical protein
MYNYNAEVRAETNVFSIDITLQKNTDSSIHREWGIIEYVDRLSNIMTEVQWCWKMKMWLEMERENKMKTFVFYYY